MLRSAGPEEVLYMSNERPDAKLFPELSFRAIAKAMLHLVLCTAPGVNLHLASGTSVMQLAQGKMKADAPIQGHLVESYSS